MTRERLDQEIRELLLAIELCSHVPAAQVGYSTGRTEHPSRMLAGGDTGALWLARRYDHARDDAQRARVIEDARAELLLIRGNGLRDLPVGESRDDLVARMLTETEGWAPEDVERSSGWNHMPARMVRRYRVAACRDAHTGHILEEHADDDLEPSQQARDYADKGMSVRQIAMLLGKAPTQIQRFIGKRAA